jgi:hypothetical protein
MRWALLVAGAITVGLAILGIMILPTLVNFLPYAIRGYPLEWSALGLALAFIQARSFVGSRTANDPAAARVRQALNLLDAGSSRAFHGGLVIALALLASAQLLSWAPHYLTWPWCRDVDTFATLALSWDSGIRPYRDIRSYNFPGHIYLHWLLGRAFGWGRTVPFYAFDLAAVLALGVVLLIWSRRKLDGFLPGLFGYFTFLGFYLCREYHGVAQRDWHASLGAALSLMALEFWPRRPALWTAAALQAAALTIRPHAVFFLPAICSALAARRRPARDALEWAIALIFFTSLGFAPLLMQGLLDDLLRGLNDAAYWGPYSKVSLADALTVLRGELRGGWTLALVGSLIVLWIRDRQTDHELERTWLLGVTGALLYRSVHPVQHGYLANPFALFSSIALAIPIARIIIASWPQAPLRVFALLMILLESTPRVPSFCSASASLRAVSSLARGVEPESPPPGCIVRWFTPNACHYEWANYRRTLDYLRRSTSPETEIANLLKEPPFPSFNGPVGRLSPFRAESGICWMWSINLDLDVPFAESLERSQDSVVVWSPAEIDFPPPFKLEQVSKVVLRYYRPEARFGPIEVWKRSTDRESGRLPAKSASRRITNWRSS